jgi:hypothetical protein
MNATPKAIVVVAIGSDYRRWRADEWAYVTGLS